MSSRWSSHPWTTITRQVSRRRWALLSENDASSILRAASWWQAVDLETAPKASPEGGRSPSRDCDVLRTARHKRRHPRNGQHAGRGVLERHDAISVDHAAASGDVPRGAIHDRKRRHACGKFDVSHEPTHPRVHGVAELL